MASSSSHRLMAKSDIRYALSEGKLRCESFSLEMGFSFKNGHLFRPIDRCYLYSTNKDKLRKVAIL